jgi:hypothetical protein
VGTEGNEAGEVEDVAMEKVDPLDETTTMTRSPVCLSHA